MASVDVLKKSISFAVGLRDDFTGRRPLVGSSRVSLAGSSRFSVPNPSGYYPFFDLPGTVFTLRVENEFYFDSVSAVDTRVLDSRNPIVRIALRPTYRYPFPESATLVRGIVTDTNGAPVAQAKVSLVGSSLASESWQDGRFVLYLAALEEDDVKTIGERRYLQIAGETLLSVLVEHSSQPSKQLEIGRVEESRTTLLKSPIALSA